MIIQEAGRLLDLQTCKPVYQLASRPVRIRNRSPEGGLAATLIARMNRTSGLSSAPKK